MNAVNLVDKRYSSHAVKACTFLGVTVRQFDIRWSLSSLHAYFTAPNTRPEPLNHPAVRGLCLCRKENATTHSALVMQCPTLGTKHSDVLAVYAMFYKFLLSVPTEDLACLPYKSSVYP